ncbi:hypothetical protein BDN72DRAFT_737008, partial [Pluteus cervinus]
LLLWILCNLTYQEIRDKLQDKDGVFQKKLIEYLESVHVGEFQTGTQEQVVERAAEEERLRPANSEDPYLNPIETLPLPPPEKCSVNCGTCDLCQSYNTWYSCYVTMTDDIISKSNIHKCGKQYTGCMDNKWGKCRARFPRIIVEKSYVDDESKGLILKKKEEWINTYTPVLSYLFRCNTDVTSLKSGTAANGIVRYATDYVTKSSLKTRVIFETIRSMFER